MMTYAPGGTSVKNLIHMAQLIQAKNRLFFFDHKDTKKNIKAYGQQSPPEIDIRNSLVPVILLSGG
jgi:trehalose-6-phosphatase